jgi:hypothetical protein
MARDKNHEGRTTVGRRSTIADKAKALGVLAGAVGLVLAHGAPASAQERPLTAQTLVDRAEIEDLLARYYWNFGGGGESFTSFYTSDAELILGKNSYKGTAGIEGAYNAVPKDVPQRKSYSFNVLPGNVLIVLHGDQATAQLVFTEVVIDKQGDPPRILTQGREYDHLVKQKGRWLISKRQIMGAADKPADWPK